MTGQREALARVDKPFTVHFQDRDIAVDEVADVQILAVVAPHHALGQAAHVDVLDVRHLLAVDLQQRDRPVAAIEECLLVRVVAA